MSRESQVPKPESHGPQPERFIQLTLLFDWPTETGNTSMAFAKLLRLHDPRHMIKATAFSFSLQPLSRVYLLLI
jgi:hypothetical protein